MPDAAPLSSLPRSAVNAVAMSSVRRTSSGRAIRNNTRPPTNYYAARPFASLAAASAMNGTDRDDNSSPGFFPGLQYFSDAITALPKEVMRQFTLMKEVEAKVHGPNERMGEFLDALLELPIPTRSDSEHGRIPPGMLSLTASNSAMGSANPSVINGIAPTGQVSVEPSVHGDEQPSPPLETEVDIARRRQYYELRALTHGMLPSLDEKNVVLAEANRVLAQQLVRVDSVMPHVEGELSDEARLGSMTHWAYSENRQKKHAPGPAARRDMAAANNLVAAASVMHEMDITQARRDAGKEAVREKHKGRGKEHADSEFEDRPKKTHAKVAKAKAAATGLGISTNGEPVKRRKVDKGLAAPAMERSFSAKGSKPGRETPRSTPSTADLIKKTTKVKPGIPGPKKKPPGSTHASPALASSPLHSSFNASNLMEPPPAAAGMRSQSTRLRQNSNATNLRHERTVDEDDGRPPTAAGRTNGANGNEKINGKRKAPADEDIDGTEAVTQNDQVKKTTERDHAFKRESDTDMVDVDTRALVSQSTSNSGRAGRNSKTGTPRDDTLIDGADGAGPRAAPIAQVDGGHESSSSETQSREPTTMHRHQRNPSSHLVKQLAPFNRSPEYDRHSRDSTGDNDEVENLSGGQDRGEVEGSQPRQSRSRRNTLASKRNTGALNSPSFSNLSPPRQDDEAPNELPLAPTPTAQSRGDVLQAFADEAVPSLEADDGADDNSSPPASPLSPHRQDLSTHLSEPLDDGLEDDIGDEDDDDSEEHDPDDPNEPRYCYCNRGSYGEMVACDNDDCPREWFHLGCTELRRAPAEEEKWFCVQCRPLFVSVGRGRGGGRGSGRGRGRGRARVGV